MRESFSYDTHHDRMKLYGTVHKRNGYQYRAEYRTPTNNTLHQLHKTHHYKNSVGNSKNDCIEVPEWFKKEFYDK